MGRWNIPRRLIACLVLGLLLTLPERVGAANKFEFDLPAGPAEQTLNLFARQSRMQVIFPTELARNVQTNAIRGAYSVREALDRLLAGSILAAEIEEAAGTIAISRAVLRAEEVVQLPPYWVDADPVAWRYIRVGDIEVISACLDDVTKRVIEQVQRLQEALGLILAPEFLARSDVPTIYVLLNERNQTTMSQNLEEELQRHAQQSAAPGNKPTDAWSVNVLRNYRFWDRDGHAIFFVLNQDLFLRERIRFTAAYLRDLLERRTPALPGWLIAGVMELNRTMVLEPYIKDSFSMEVRGRQMVPAGVAILGPAQWLSVAETKKIGKGRQAPELLPLSVLFSAPPPEAADQTRRLWRAQAALFVRWSLDGSNSPRREALWRLLRQADHGPITEANFRECFGMSYLEAETELRRYLPKAVRKGFELHPARWENNPDYLLRLASETEIGLVKGDLDRLMIRYVRSMFPLLTEKYIEQARRTLRRAYDLGERDPRLVGLMGLCEVDARDDAAARPWLEEAVAGGVVRPRVYLELARIRYRALLARSGGGQLNEADLTEVIRPLEIARTQSPPLAEVYGLLAEVWRRHTTSLTRNQLAVLDEGLNYFPRRAELISVVARLNARQHRMVESIAMVARGLAMANDSDSHRQLQQLLAELSAGAGPEKPAAP